MQGDFDIVRLLHGDHVADLPEKDRTRLLQLKWGMRGNLVNWVHERLHAQPIRNPFWAPMVADFEWMIGAIREAALSQNADRVVRLIQGLAAIDNPPAAERELARAILYVMSGHGDVRTRRIFLKEADLRKGIRTIFPEVLSRCKDGGRSTVHRALKRWNIVCKPR